MPRVRLVGALIQIGHALLDLKRGMISMDNKLDGLKAAIAANAASTVSAVAALLALQDQHKADLAALAAKAQGIDDAELQVLVASIQDRTATIDAALQGLHGDATKAAEAAPAAGIADTVSGAGSDTTIGGTADSVAGADTATVAGADSVTGTGTDTVSAG